MYDHLSGLPEQRPPYVVSRPLRLYFASSFQLSELRIVWRSYRRVPRELNIVRRGTIKESQIHLGYTIGQEGEAKQLENPNNHSLMSRLFFNHFPSVFPQTAKRIPYTYTLFRRKGFQSRKTLVLFFFWRFYKCEKLLGYVDNTCECNISVLTVLLLDFVVSMLFEINS